MRVIEMDGRARLVRLLAIPQTPPAANTTVDWKVLFDSAALLRRKRNVACLGSGRSQCRCSPGLVEEQHPHPGLRLDWSADMERLSVALSTPARRCFVRNSFL